MNVFISHSPCLHTNSPESVRDCGSDVLAVGARSLSARPNPGYGLGGKERQRLWANTNSPLCSEHTALAGRQRPSHFPLFLSVPPSLYALHSLRPLQQLQEQPMEPQAAYMRRGFTMSHVVQVIMGYIVDCKRFLNGYLISEETFCLILFQ